MIARNMIGFLVLVVIAGCGGYGAKLEFNKGELYFKDGITEAEAKQVGSLLVQNKLFDGTRKTVQLVRDKESVVVRFAAAQPYWDNPELDEGFKVLFGRLTVAFPKTSLEIHVCDDRLRTKRVLKPDPFEEIKKENILVFAFDPVAKKDGEKLGQTLAALPDWQEGEKEIYLRKDQKGFLVGVVLADENAANEPLVVKDFQALGKILSKDALGGHPVTIQFLTQKLKEIKRL